MTGKNWKLINRVWHANLGMAAVITLGIIALSCPFIAHGWEAGKFLIQIHYGKFLPKETRWLWIDTQGLLLGLLVVSGFLMHRKSVKQAASTAADDPTVAGSSVTVMGGDAGALAALGAQRGLRTFGCADDKIERLDFTLERWLILTRGGDQARLTARLGTLRAGSLKRLHYALEPGAENEALERALRAAGARPLKLADTATNSSNSGSGWTAAVIDHLCAESPTLAGR